MHVYILYGVIVWDTWVSTKKSTCTVVLVRVSNDTMNCLLKSNTGGLFITTPAADLKIYISAAGLLHYTHIYNIGK